MTDFATMKQEMIEKCQEKIIELRAKRAAMVQGIDSEIALCQQTIEQLSKIGTPEQPQAPTPSKPPSSPKPDGEGSEPLKHPVVSVARFMGTPLRAWLGSEVTPPTFGEAMQMFAEHTFVVGGKTITYPEDLAAGDEGRIYSALVVLHPKLLQIQNNEADPDAFLRSVLDVTTIDDFVGVLQQWNIPTSS